MPSPRRKGHVSFGDDDVSDMSSSFGSNHAVSIFRPKPPPSYDEDESLLLHKVVDGVLDQALGRSRSKFDVDAMTTEEEMIQRLGNFQSHEESLGEFREKRQRGFRDPLAAPPRGTSRSPPQQPKRNRSDKRRLMENDLSIPDERSVHSKGPNFEFKRILWVFFLLFVVACTLGGIAGLIVILLQEKGTESATSQEQVEPSWAPPTQFPTVSPSHIPTIFPSLDPTPRPSTMPSSVPPTPAPTTQVPTKLPTDPPTTLSPSLQPTPIPTSAAPTRQLTLEEKIILASPGTETAFIDPTSPQSLALLNMGSAAPSLDRFALFTLMYSANVSTWDASALHCSWTGITCDDDGFVQKVELRHSDLIGTLPDELALATNLQVVSIAGSGTSDIKSNIVGSIPELWGELLSNLRVLELYDNRLGGRIPDSFWKFSNVEHFHLDGNQLTGIFPDSLALMSSLKTFDVSDNYMVGSVPEEWTSLSHLARLSLKGNQMYGTLPSGIGSLGVLQELHLQGNSFRGSLPSALSSLTSLGWLSLEENQFTGTLPLVYSSMAILEGLELRGNKFRGALPSTYGSMSLLRILDMSRNFLTGSIPTEWNALSNLAALSLHHNQLHGDVSETICDTVMHIESDCNENMECSCCTACFVSS
jgi:hypothetical protein